jgi:hypothetical protein
MIFRTFVNGHTIFFINIIILWQVLSLQPIFNTITFWHFKHFASSVHKSSANLGKRQYTVMVLLNSDEAILGNKYSPLQIFHFRIRCD